MHPLCSVLLSRGHHHCSLWCSFSNLLILDIPDALALFDFVTAQLGSSFLLVLSPGFFCCHLLGHNLPWYLQFNFNLCFNLTFPGLYCCQSLGHYIALGICNSNFSSGHGLAASGLHLSSLFLATTGPALVSCSPVVCELCHGLVQVDFP